MNRRDFLKRISSAVPVIVGAGLLTKVSFEKEFIEKDWYQGEEYDFSRGEKYFSEAINGTILSFRGGTWTDL